MRQSDRIAAFAANTSCGLFILLLLLYRSEKEGCIYWYPKSLNYYYYEIRHDNAANSYMEYGKYGVVRNNYYTLTLTKVNGNGTPWYPGGGPEDPDEEEDIDKKGAYLHFEIKVAPWIYWTTNFEI